jgi:CelD/BcsL family acetyltransferase involved in cellulose biosynthesis
MSTAAAALMPRVSAPAALVTVGTRTSVDAIAALGPEWARLLERCPGADLFSTPSWHIAWWRAFGEGRTPCVLEVRDAGRLIAVLPLACFKDTLRGMPVRVAGSYNNEHASRTGMVIEPGQEARAVRALAQHLAQDAASWDVLMLRQWPAQAAWLQPFIDAASDAGLSPFAPTPGIGKCVLPLAGSWDDFLATRSRHFRMRLKENLRRVGKHGAVVFRRSSGSKEDFDTFARLEKSTWKVGDENARLGSRGWAFQREVALAKQADIRCVNLFLEIDGVVVGGVHAVSHGAVLYSMQTLFDESVRHLYPGRVQFAVHVADGFESPQHTLLDLNGNSEFCKSWTNTELAFVDMQIYNRRPYSRVLAQLKRSLGRNR